MLPSVEARWFIRGTAPKEALEWINRWELAPATSEDREDHYLRLPDTVSIGVKLREGKFEVKRRDIDLGVITFGPRVTGRLALWRKWSFKVADDGGNRAPDGHWVTVGKERFLRKYSKETSGLIAVSPKGFPARGCTVELTHLHVRGTEWWSVGFEAFSPDEGELRDTLTLAAEKCFQSEDHPTLDAEDSFDYPEWLASMSD